MNDQFNYEQQQTPSRTFMDTRSNEGVTHANGGSVIQDSMNDRRGGYHSMLQHPNQYERIQTICENTQQIDPVEPQAIARAGAQI